MNDNLKTSWALTGLTVMFSGLTGWFVIDALRRPEPMPSVPLVDAAFTNTATVRLSAAELTRTGGDTSGLSCYSCHEKGKVPELHFGANNEVVLSKEHEDLVMRHGRNARNDNCFNCHDPEGLDTLKTRDGRKLQITESTLLCANCHGPTYRDWEAGIHGRTSGHWNRQLGAITRLDCVSCHDPHAPAFPSMKPAPGPHPLHPAAKSSREKVTGS